MPCVENPEKMDSDEGVGVMSSTTDTSAIKEDNPARQRPSGDPSLPVNSSPSQKLRRKTPLTDPFAESSAVQRLVEYFVVVSCQTDGSNPKQPNNHDPSKSDKDNDAKNDTRHERPSRESRTEASSKNLKNHRQQSAETSPPLHHNKTFKPRVTARYPEKDHQDNPLNPMILQFCFPKGEDAIIPERKYRLPRIHYFVLTNDKGRKVYGICLTILEEYKPEEGDYWKTQALLDDSLESGEIEMSAMDDKAKLYLPKVLCLLSTWPYLTAFREYLAQLYRLATATNVMKAPIERYIVNLCSEIPAPPPGAYEIQVKILDSAIRFWAPPAKLPIAYVALPYNILFECLDLEHILDLFCAMIMEHKIVLLSSQYSILTVCSEILCSLLFPMRWSHLYIPILPRMLCPMLDAPVPYIVGVIRENWSTAEEHVARDAIVVDLDQNKVVLGPDIPEIPSPPQKKWSKLRQSLQTVLGNLFENAHGHDLAPAKEQGERPSRKGLKKSLSKLRATKDGHQWQEKLESWDHAFNLAYTPDSELMDNFIDFSGYSDGQTQWEKVQESFLRFFVAILKGYRNYLVLPKASDGASRPSFDAASFLEAQPAHNKPFLEGKSINLSRFFPIGFAPFSHAFSFSVSQGMCLTQQFDDFITRRMYSPGEPELVFFDQSIDAKLNRSRLRMKKLDTPFLQNAKAHKVLKLVDAIEPNDFGLRDFYPNDVLKEFMYKTWPASFDRNLFSRPRPIPEMISAEFDRQALLVSKLRIENVDFDDHEEEFFGGDYDPSPEVGAFSVFFFVYSALVGLEWQDYKDKALKIDRGRSNATASTSKETRDDSEAYVEQVETVFQPDVHEASDLCAQDLTFGICSDNGVKALRSTLVYVGKSTMEDVYSAFFKEASERVNDVQEQLKLAHQNSKDNEEEVREEMEEVKEVASAQLDLAFEVLRTLSMRRLPADLDAYKSLMEACGRCGDTEKARHLIEVMKKDGFVLDGEILSCFVAAFAQQEEGDETGLPGSGLKASIAFKSRRSKDAYTSYIEKGLVSMQEQDDESRPWLNDSFDNSDTQSVGSRASLSSDKSSVLDWFGTKEPRTRKTVSTRRRKKRSIMKFLSQSNTTTPIISAQVDLGRTLLEYLYPDLEIDTNHQSCPHCSKVLSEDEVVAGWTPCAFEDFTTSCRCSHRFVPHFSVKCSSATFQGSQGAGSALFCEFLSPWVVRRALNQVIKGDVGIRGMIDPSWRNTADIRATLFWNLVVLCRRYNLPFAFLLQGSFQGRLILPKMPRDM